MKQGFTLIELLVVIAMIGILTGVVIASLGSSRAKARDGKRVSDIGQIQLALEMYYEQNRRYPVQIYETTNPKFFEGIYMSTTPKDPFGTNYPYAVSPNGSNYHLGTKLEQVSPDGYNQDTDLTMSENRSWTNGFSGVGSCTNTETSPDQCYDVKGSNAEQGTPSASS